MCWILPQPVPTGIRRNQLPRSGRPEIGLKVDTRDLRIAVLEAQVAVLEAEVARLRADRFLGPPTFAPMRVTSSDGEL